MLITVVEGDITTQEVDAVVNAANRRIRGVDGAIHTAGGSAIPEDYITRFPNGLDAGDTGWTMAGETDRDHLTSRYTRALGHADELGARSVAFPLVSADTYGWPKEDAIAAAVEALNAASSAVDEARLVAFGQPTYAAIARSLASQAEDWIH
ncbi:appr-1-p processing domain-containing protein [Janibacter hoylei PVAS-1]|uniref:Appr-1-p processing domain-containing protein n=1 Tax=Janibacter hoylei PVAS-1 TaxID=1210046 RepID=K1DZN4_9MICO|nr:macro domain-containing protein [Janibacter hoylei]EKA60221.1 appr-1-p processing domain-containing protein [Janibacter hoylei PVAS-1]RWU83845.1 RNase III inhibitor [Janibacter hoylei PVAS-1]